LIEIYLKQKDGSHSHACILDTNWLL